MSGRSWLHMSNFPLAYRLSWLPRLLKPSLARGWGGYTPSAATWLEPPPSSAARLAFLGDISAVASRAPPIVHPAIRDLLASVDLAVGNCESPVVEKARAPIGTVLGIRHAMSERFLADALAAVGIARHKMVLSVANNHVLDQGVEGFDETLDALRRLGIGVAGLAAEPVARIGIRTNATQDSLERRTPSSLREAVRGGGALTIGFAAFTQWRNAGREAFAGRVVMADDPRTWPNEHIEACDFLCALPHWDWEFRHFPRPGTRTLARKLADAGVGLIAGSHAHVVQPIESVGNALVAYGLGDFFGTALPRLPWPGRIGAVLVVDVSLDPVTCGRIAGYRLHFFLRELDGGRERLTPVAALDGPLREKVFGRLAAVYGAADQD